MKSFGCVCVVIIAATVAGGCATPAPGAAQVTITGNPTDVAGCTPVGNIGTETMNDWDPVVARNRTVGFNGNVILNTGRGGIAYRCDRKAVSSK